MRALYKVKATGQMRIAKLGENIQDEESARKAMNIRYGDAIEILNIVDVNEE